MSKGPDKKKIEEKLTTKVQETKDRNNHGDTINMRSTHQVRKLTRLVLLQRLCDYTHSLTRSVAPFGPSISCGFNIQFFFCSLFNCTLSFVCLCLSWSWSFCHRTHKCHLYYGRMALLCSGGKHNLSIWCRSFVHVH